MAAHTGFLGYEAQEREFHEEEQCGRTSGPLSCSLADSSPEESCTCAEGQTSPDFA